jgi:hypothetical protein
MLLVAPSNMIAQLIQRFIKIKSFRKLIKQVEASGETGATVKRLNKLK